VVQAPGPIPLYLREHVGTRVYGCDDCQDACPPNHRAVRQGDVAATLPPGLEAYADLQWLLEATDDDILRRYDRFYIPGNDARYIRRNALVALGNLGDPAARPLVDHYLDHPDELLREHARWAHDRLSGRARADGVGDRRGT
jgi:epoxyqueuosine reductase